ISGPIVLTASVHMRGGNAEGVTAWLDLKPALDAQTLDERLLREIENAPNTQFSNLVPKLLPKSMTAALCDACGIGPGVKLNVLTREMRHALGKTLKRFPIGEVKKSGFEEAVVTAGGVSTRQVSPKTMESKLVQGLYFAGEILDVDGYTGGFNLQIAWSSARAAAEAACAQDR
ncbi:MAG: NAD(P)/FAD-dependent oxidoreductase, partial [Oscillospiraceae bacterium]|nr:NAD(P)/FAD-dependent oxidoreductase [Oscillospiraceae bacterium]